MQYSRALKWVAVLLGVLLGRSVLAQTGESLGAGVTSADIATGFADPTRWLTFSGDYSGARHSP